MNAYLAAFFARDVPALVACFAPDAVLEDAREAVPSVGAAAIRAYFERFFGVVRSYQVVQRRYFELGDAVLTVLEASVERSDLGDAPVHYPAALLLEFTPEGLVRRMRWFFDPASVIRFG
jgi:ketosteroid isomerase-like protein